MTTGTVIAVTDSYADVRFPGDAPAPGRALRVARAGGPLLLEVEERLAGGVARCALLGPAAGVQTGARVADTGGPLSVPVGPALLGRVIDLAGEPLDGRPPLDDAPRRPIGLRAPAGAKGGLLETGIKVIDLLAPIPRGGAAGIFAPPRAGKLVVMTELVQRMARLGGAAVFVGSEARTYEVTDLMRSMADSGLSGGVAMVFARVDDPPAVASRAALAGLTVAEEAAERGAPALLFLDRELVEPAEIGLLAAALGPGVTLIVHGPPTDDPGPLDALIRCDPALGERRLWPAVDRLAAASQLLDGLGANHRAAATAARELLRRAGEPALARRAELLERYLTQPFFCAEEYTDIPGEYVPAATTVRDVAAICAGAYDRLDPAALQFVGAIEADLASAR